MPTRLSESRVDHHGEALPEGVYALVNEAGKVVSYKSRWREEDAKGVGRQRSRRLPCCQRGRWKVVR